VFTLFIVAVVNTDASVSGKVNVQFPLPGRVGFAPSQPESTLTKSELVDSHQSSADVSGALTAYCIIPNSFLSHVNSCCTRY